MTSQLAWLVISRRVQVLRGSRWSPECPWFGVPGWAGAQVWAVPGWGLRFVYISNLTARAELVTARAELVTARAKLVTGRADLVTGRADLVTARADLVT